MKTLICIAPDGECVLEGQFDTIKAAWERSNNMGSRWVFYPVHVVTGASRTRHARILDTPEEIQHWKGRTLASLCKAFAACSQEVCEWINGEAPCPV